MAMAISAMGMGLGLRTSLQMPNFSTERRTSIGQGSSSYFKGSTLSLPSFGGMRTKKSGAVSVAVVARQVLQGKVVCATNDKTVRVQVYRLAVHPKYKKRVRVKKNYQAHDPNNTFAVGDMVQLQSCRPISKTKAFLAIPLPPRNNARSLSPSLQSTPT